jgi:hypothetical protein
MITSFADDYADTTRNDALRLDLMLDFLLD